jgi:hypothetical protein
VSGSFWCMCGQRVFSVYQAFSSVKFLFQNPIALHVSWRSCSQSLSFLSVRFLLPFSVCLRQIAILLQIQRLAWAYRTRNLVSARIVPGLCIILDSIRCLVIGDCRCLLRPRNFQLKNAMTRYGKLTKTTSVRSTWIRIIPLNGR